MIYCFYILFLICNAVFCFQEIEEYSCLWLGLISVCYDDLYDFEHICILQQ